MQSGPWLLCLLFFPLIGLIKFIFEHFNRSFSFSCRSFSTAALAHHAHHRIILVVHHHIIIHHHCALHRSLLASLIELFLLLNGVVLALIDNCEVKDVAVDEVY